MNLMTAFQAKQLVNILGRKLKAKEKRILFNAIGLMDKNIDRKLSPVNEFEFSVIANEPKIRFVHLSFWQKGLDSAKLAIVLSKRQEIIKYLARWLGLKFKCIYDFSFCEDFLKFNEENGCWPVQVALEHFPGAKPKIKVYLGINAQEFPLQKFCKHFGLDYRELKGVVGRRRLDTVGLDLLPDGKEIIKFYPLTAPNKGFLYRVNGGLGVSSIKIWLKFPRGLSINDAEKSGFKILPAPIRNFIKKNNLKIRYLCEERGKKSVFFR